MDRASSPAPLAGASPPPRIAVAGALAFVSGPGRAGDRADDAGAEPPDGFVCPFCGETYPASRRRCAGCGGLPVVPREDREVYEAVVGLCGPDCETTARRTDRSTPYAHWPVSPR